MTYTRVIPRDLFNEASLLKCIGHLWIETERYTTVRLIHSGAAFNICQDDLDGSTYCGNVTIIIANRSYDHRRPLNSRDAWPLWLTLRNDPDADEFEAFDGEGNLSPELLALLESGK
jgi:hypothetical protein